MDKEKILETYNITYSCGCIHEIEAVKGGLHRATDNNKDCEEHKVKEEVLEDG